MTGNDESFQNAIRESALEILRREIFDRKMKQSNATNAVMRAHVVPVEICNAAHVGGGLKVDDGGCPASLKKIVDLFFTPRERSDVKIRENLCAIHKGAPYRHFARGGPFVTF